MEKSLKRILVPLDPSVYTSAATDTACRIAKVHGASVAGVAVLDSKEIASSVVPAVGPYYPMMVEVVQEKLEHARHVLDDCLKRFKSVCDNAEVAHFETEYEGLPAQKLLESSIFFDLVVMGLETFFHFETRKDDGKGDCLSKVLDRTVTPVLAVPAEGLEKIESALITFDGSMGSARAMQDFARLAAPYNVDVTVLVAEKEEKEAEFLLRNAEEFLSVHGFANVVTEHAKMPIESAVDDARLADCDLVVAGIHSRKYFKDYFVGSFAKDLISRNTRPLLLSH